MAGERRGGDTGAGAEVPSAVAGAFARTLVTAPSSAFEYRLGAGDNRVFTGAGADLGDAARWGEPQSTGPVVGARVVTNACVYNVLAKIVRVRGEQESSAAAAAGRAPPPWATRASAATSGGLIAEVHTAAAAMRSALAPPTDRITRTE